LVGGSGGAVETAMLAMTTGVFVATFALSEDASMTPIVPYAAELRSEGKTVSFALVRGVR